MYTRIIPASIKLGDLLKLRTKDNEDYEEIFWAEGFIFFHRFIIIVEVNIMIFYAFHSLH